MAQTIDIHGRKFLRALGHELREARQQRGWSRRELLRRLGHSISLQTLASWEQGTRRCTALLVWHLCEVLDVPVDELYVRVRKRLNVAGRGLMIDLRSAATTDFTGLGPLQAWSRIQLRAYPEE